MADHRTLTPSEPIVYIDRSEIREGAIDELRAGVQRLVEFIDRREPQLITYGFYIDDDTRKMTVVAVHPDPASLQLHLDIGGGVPQTRASASVDRDRMLRTAERTSTRTTAGESRCVRRRRDGRIHRPIRGVRAPLACDALSEDRA